MLEGITKIELHDVVTGEDTVIEKHNMITNHLQTLFDWHSNGIPIFGTQTFMGGNKDNYFGGILMFENPLDEDPNSYFIPAPSQNPITAHVNPEVNAYDTLDLTLGVNNATHTKSGQTYVTYVADFDQEHGNGKISAIAMVPRSFVWMGGFGHKKDCTSPTNIYSYQCGFHLYGRSGFSIGNFYRYIPRIPNVTYEQLMPIGISLKRKKVYVMINGKFYNNSAISIYECDMLDNTFNLFHTSESAGWQLIGAEGTRKMSGFRLVKTISFADYGLTGSTYHSVYCDMSTDKFYILQHKEFTAGTTVKLVELNLVTGDVIARNITHNIKLPNSSGVLTNLTFDLTHAYGLNTNSQSTTTPYGYLSSFMVANGYLILGIDESWDSSRYNQNRGVYAINIENNADIHRFVTPGFTSSAGVPKDLKTYGNMDSPYMDSFYKVGDKIYIMYQVKSDYTANAGSVWELDMNNFGAYKTKIQNLFVSGNAGTGGIQIQHGSSSYTYTFSFGMSIDAPEFMSVNYPNTWLESAIYPHCNVLSTINNLDVPVEKTSTQTMRVTYTVRERETE